VAKKSKFACVVEYAALRTVCGVVNAIPYPLACAFARAAASIAFGVFGFKRKRTLERILGAFPEMDLRQASRVAAQSLANLLQNAVEMTRAPKLGPKWIDRHVADLSEYHRRLKALVDEGNGVVIMVPHTGNWYMAAWAMASRGLPLFALAATPSNPLVAAWLKRQYCTISVLERGSPATLREIRARLHSGQGFAILPDLRVPQPDVAVPFLGGEANVSHAGALFAVRANAPIVVAAMRREHGKHVFNHLATLRPDPSAADAKEEARRLTREAFKLLDSAVRADPGQWFWFNKRWILQPPNGKPCGKGEL